MSFAEFLNQLAPEGLESIVAAAVVAILATATAAIFGAGVYYGRMKRREKRAQLEASLAEARGEVRRIRPSLDAAVRENEDLHRRLAASRDHMHRVRRALSHGYDRGLTTRPTWGRAPSQIPIVAIGNLKGGVGKTTLTANLGAYLGDTAHRRAPNGKPVLFIDLDFQGSLSSILIGAGRDLSGAEAPNKNAVTQLFDNAITDENRRHAAREIMHGRMAGSCFYDADVPFSIFEEQEYFEWVFRGEPGFEDDHVEEPIEDPRLWLGDFLHSAVVQREFGAVMIDLPPRTTLFAYAALLAANNVIIPTREDQLSRVAAQNFVSFLESGRESLWPRLNIVGVAGVNTTPNSQRSEEVDELLRRLAADLDDIWNGAQQPLSYLGKAPWMAQIAEVAGEDFAYFDARENVKAGSPNAIFTGIGDAVRAKLRL